MSKLMKRNTPDVSEKPVETQSYIKLYLQDVKLFEDYLTSLEMSSASIQDLKRRILQYLEFIEEYDSKINPTSLQDFFEIITLTDPDCAKTVSTLSRYFKFHQRKDLVEVCRCYNKYKPDQKYRLTKDQEQLVIDFMDYLVCQEKSKSTVASYSNAASDYLEFLADEPITKKNSILFKDELKLKYKATTINAKITGLNAFLEFLDLEDDQRLKSIKVQKSSMREDSKQLTVNDFIKMYRKADDKYKALMLTLALTGIRISEVPFITREAVNNGEATIDNKGKIRTLLFNTQLQKHLLYYCNDNHIYSGPIFLSSNETPLNRSNTWKHLRKVAKEAGVDIEKSNPHNFRRLFARLFYNTTHDISMLADILGHDSIHTTQLYLANSKSEMQRAMEQIILPTTMEEWNANPTIYQGSQSYGYLSGSMGINSQLEEVSKKLDLLISLLKESKNHLN